MGKAMVCRTVITTWKREWLMSKEGLDFFLKKKCYSVCYEMKVLKINNCPSVQSANVSFDGYYLITP